MLVAMAMISGEALVRSRSFWLVGLCPDPNPDPGPLQVRTYSRSSPFGVTYVLTYQLLRTKTEMETYEIERTRSTP